jgi:magnesium transporter
MPDAQTTGVVQALPVAVAAKILEELPKFEQADIVSELSPTDQDCILAELPKDSATVVRQLVNYESDEAGGLMTVRYVAVRENDSVASIVNQLQKNAATYSDFAVQYIYVVDASGKLLGVVPLRSLVLTTPETLVQEIMISNPLAVRTDDDLLTLHEFFEGHQFVGVPVVEENFTLVGVLRRGDVEEAISKRNAFDYLKTQGIVNEELRTMPLTLRSRRRLAWLSINIMLNLFAAGVIAFYQETLEQVIALAVFLPIISDMSGCSGNQAVAVSMRELSLGLVSSKEVMRVWFKEIGVGLINGICLGVFIATLAFIWKGNPWLGLVVGAAMSANTIIAVSIGGTLPLIMRRFNLDPALASGPILTTVTDMCGFFLVLSGASLLLEKLIDV